MFKIFTKLFTSDKRFLIGLILIFAFSFGYGQQTEKVRVGNSPEKSKNEGLFFKGPGGAGSILVPNDDATYGSTPKILVENILAASCMTIGDVRFGYYSRSSGNWNNQFGSSTLDRQLGYFNDGSAQNFPIEEGLLLSTGKIKNAMGPSSSGSYSDQMNSLASDPDLALITGRNMYDAAVLEINFTPVGTKIEFQFVFASEEYLEYCGTQYEDIFGFFLSGPGIAGGQGYQHNAVNLAKLPNGSPITINTIHPYVASNVNGNPVAAQNPAYYANNNINVSTEFDGGTVVLTAVYNGLVSGSEYKMKMAIADASDQRWDAGVFLKAKSFTSNALVVTNPTPVCFGATVDITAPAITTGSTLPGPYTYWIDENATVPFATPTVATAGTYYIKAADTNSGCEVIQPVTVTVYDKPLVDNPSDVTVCDSYTLPGLTNGSYYANSGGQNPISVGTVITSTQTIYVYAETGTIPNCTSENSFLVTINTAPIVDAGTYGPLCDNVNAITLTGTPTNSNGSWSGTGITDNGDGTASFNPTGLSGSITVTYDYTDGNSCSNSDTATIEVNTAPTVDAGTYGPLCNNVSAIALTGTPTNSNGSWSGTGITDNGDGTASFNPTGLSGSITVTYDYTDGNSCS
ncbi:choice-of-anchor L domain-containing protein, partial [Aequorivita sp. Q41]|uniref:choice-of-anchor L domain-containing protein n=1 Tax=Aequorivita sp. Q41 TaxID=3153300 RepID=UPI00324281B3